MFIGDNMLTIVKQNAFTKKYILIQLALFVIFLSLYVFLDFEGSGNYQNMANNFGISTVIIHFGLNIIIAILSAIMVTYSIINFNLTKIEPKGSNAIPFLSFILGVLTFGCTSCVIAFFAAIGIAFTPLVLPNANLLWKVIATLFVALGFIWIMYSIQNTKCKIKQ
jgi:hypothetical protein